LDFFAKLLKNCLECCLLECCLEAEAFSWCEVGGEGDVPDFRVRTIVDIDLTWQPAPQSAIGVFDSALLPTLPEALIKPADTKSAGVLHLASELRGHWEGDLTFCKRTRPVLVLHERKSRVTPAARLAGKIAAETISVMLAVFARIEPALRKSITIMTRPSLSMPCCGPCAPCLPYSAMLMPRSRKTKVLQTFVRDRLAEGWTPEQISGWLREETNAVCSIVPRLDSGPFVPSGWLGACC
jgi:hypothetical protein